MKAKIINGKIKIGLPRVYNGITGTYPGGFHLLSDNIHNQEGFYEIVEPVYNQQLQMLGEIYWDNENKIFTYNIIDRVFDLEELKNKHRNDVQIVLREISQIASDVKNVYDPLRTNPENIPEGFKLLVGQLLPLRERANMEINALTTPEEALNYVVRGPEIEGYIEQLKSFL